jgi:hypothetical protein
VSTETTRPGLRYVLVPGEIRSRQDGDVHFIDAPTLARLYQLRPGEWTAWKRGLRPDLIVLGPRADGRYMRPR